MLVRQALLASTTGLLFCAVIAVIAVIARRLLLLSFRH